MRRAITAHPLVIPLALLALAGCGQGRTAAGAASEPAFATVGNGVVGTPACAEATGSPGVVTGASPMPANHGRLSDIAGRIHTRGEKDFAAVYGEVRIVTERDKLELYRKPSAELDRWVLADFADHCVEMIDTRYSAVELGTMQERVAGDFDYWKARGIQLNVISRDFVHGGLTVGTEQVERARRELPARYGAALPIRVEHQGEVVPLTG